jgi:opacity protein-like surface antigen
MKIKEILLASIVISTVFLNYAYADEHMYKESYIGLGFSPMNSSVPNYGSSLNLSSLSIILGTKINENFSVETRMASGVSSDNSLKLKNLYGAYLKAGIPVSETIYPYAILGYSKASVKSSSSSTTIKNESDASMGLGVDIKLNKSINVQMEYTNYIKDNGFKIGGLGLSISNSF